MTRIGRIWNALANPKRIPRLFSVILGVLLLAGFLVPMGLNDNQLYPRPAPQLQINEQDPLAPYDRGGAPLTEPGIVKSQYPQFSVKSGMVTGYLSPISISTLVSRTSFPKNSRAAFLLSKIKEMPKHPFGNFGSSTLTPSTSMRGKCIFIVITGCFMFLYPTNFLSPNRRVE